MAPSLLGLGVRGMVVLSLVTALSVYLTYPPPQMSPTLIKWITRGSYFEFNGHKIFYQDSLLPNSQTNDGPTLILLHGFPTNSYDWHKMWPGLARSFSRVIALDFIGFGFSDKPQDHDYTITEQADIYERLLKELDITDVHILAHDYGDTVAQEMLARFNERDKDRRPYKIHSVCLLNGGIFPETNFPLPVQKIMAVPYLGGLVARLTNRFFISRSLGAVFGEFTQPTASESNDFYAALRVHDGNLVLPPILDFMRQRRKNKVRWTEALQMTSVPVYVIWGPADPVNPRGFLAFYTKTVPEGGITVLPEDISHYPQWEAAELVLDSFLKFISSLPPQSLTPPTESAASSESDQPTASAVSSESDQPMGSAASSESDPPTGSTASSESDLPTGSAAPSESDPPSGSAASSESDPPTGSAAPSESDPPTGSAASSESDPPTGSAAPSESDPTTGSAASSESDLPTGSDASSESDLPTGSDASSESDLPTGSDASSESDLPAGSAAPSESDPSQDPLPSQSQTPPQDPPPTEHPDPE